MRVLRLSCSAIMILTGVLADGLTTPIGQCRAAFGVYILAVELTRPPPSGGYRVKAATS